MLAVAADAAYAESGDLPGVLVSHLGDGYIKLIIDLSDEGLDDVALTFQRRVFRQTKPYLTYADVYTHGKPRRLGVTSYINKIKEIEDWS